MEARIYIRRSDDDQSAYSPEAQERQCRQWAEHHGYRVVRVYVDDDLSGTRDDRPELLRLLSDVKGKAEGVVVVHKFDRLARDTEVLLRIVYKDLRAVRVVSVMENIDPYTPLGKMMLTLSGGVSTYFVDNLRTEVSKGLAEKAARGGWVGPLPFGYRSQFDLDGRGERIKGSGRAVPSDDAETVRLIYRLYATGNQSDRSIAEELNRQGLVMVSKDGEAAFTSDTVQGILANPFYIGVVTYKGKEYSGAHDAIIETDMWERCQEIRARRGRQGGGSVPGKRAMGLLSEIAYCGECGDVMHWLESGNAQHRHRYYYCRRRRKQGSDACSAVMERADRHNERVLNVLRGMTIPPRIRESVLEGARKRLTLPTAEPKTDRAKVEEQLRRLHVAYRSGDPSLTDATYLAETARLQGLLADTPRRPAALLDLERAMGLLADMPALIERASNEQRRALVQTILRKVWIAHGEVVAITPAPVFDLLADVTVVTLTGNGVTLSTSARRIPDLWDAFGVEMRHGNA